MVSPKTIRLRALILVMLSASLLASCESPEAVATSSFNVTPKSVEMRVGESALLVATASEPLETDPKWTSSDTSRATVDALGRVLARAQGSVSVVVSAVVGTQTLTDSATVSVISGCPATPSIAALYVSGTTTLVRPDAVIGSVDVLWGGACSGTSSVARVDLVLADSISMERSVSQAAVPQPIPAGWVAPRLTFNSTAKTASGAPLFPSGPYQLRVVWTYANAAAGTSAAAIPIRVRNP